MSDRRLLENGSLRLLETGDVRLLETSTADPSIGNKPLLAVRSFLDTGTEYASDIPIRHPSRFYDPRLLALGTLERGIPLPAGLPVIGSGTINLADTPDASGVQRWRALLHTTTQRRRKIEVKTGWEGTSEQGFATVYIGEYQRATFPPDRVEISFGDLWYRWLNRQIPAIGNRANFPNLPEGVDEFFFPFVFGNCRINLQLCDTETNDYALNQTLTNAITAVYRQLPDASPLVYTLVDPSEYELITDERTIDGLYYPLSLLRFADAQPDGTKLYADVDGMWLRPEFGSMPEVSGSLHNIVDFVIALVYYAFELEPSILDFNVDSFAETRQQYDDRGLIFDGAIVEPMTFGAALAQMCACANLHIYQDRFGKLSLALIRDSDASRPVFTETLDILGGAGHSGSRTAIDITVLQPETVVNRFHYRYAKNFATGEYASSAVYDNESDQAELGEIDDGGGVIALPFISDADTALWAIETRAEYFTLRSYQVELSLDALRYIERVELAKSFGVTYYGGMGGPWVNKEFVCLAIRYEWAAARVTVRGVIRDNVEPLGAVSDVGDWARNSRIGPFWYADEQQIYAVMIDTRTAGYKKLFALRSSFNSDGFSVVDDGVFPELTNQIGSFDVHRYSNGLFVATQEATTGRVAFHTFDLVTGTWTLVNEEVLASFSTGGSAPTNTDTGVSITVRYDGSPLEEQPAILYQGDWEYRTSWPGGSGGLGAQPDGYFGRTKVKIREAGVWSSEVDVGDPNSAVTAESVPGWIAAGVSYNGHVRMRVGRIVAGDEGRLQLFLSQDEPVDVASTADYEVQTMLADHSLAACVEWRTTNLPMYTAYFAYGNYESYRDGDGNLWHVMPVYSGYLDSQLAIWQDGAALGAPDAVVEIGGGATTDSDALRSYQGGTAVRYHGTKLHVVMPNWVSIGGDKWFVYKTVDPEDAYAVDPPASGGEERDLQASPSYQFPASQYLATLEMITRSGRAWALRISPSHTAGAGFYFEAYRVDTHLPIDNGYTLTEWIADHS